MGSKIRRLVSNGIAIRYAEARKSRCVCEYCGDGGYWNVVWAGGKALYQYVTNELSQHRVWGSRVVDLGCGTGIAGLGLAKMGAYVTFVDHIPHALRQVQKHCKLNGVKGYRIRCLCWRDPAAWKKIGQYDLVLGADITYSFDDLKWLENVLKLSLKPRGIAIFSDPGRSGFDAFLGRITRSGFDVTLKWIDAVRILVAKRCGIESRDRLEELCQSSTLPWT